MKNENEKNCYDNNLLCTSINTYIYMRRYDEDVYFPAFHQRKAARILYLLSTKRKSGAQQNESWERDVFYMLTSALQFIRNPSVYSLFFLSDGLLL